LTVLAATGSTVIPLIIGNHRLTPSVNVTRNAAGTQTRVYFSSALAREVPALKRCKHIVVDQIGEKTPRKLVFYLSRGASDESFSLYREGKTEGLTFVIATSKVPFLAVGQYKPKVIRAAGVDIILSIDCQKGRAR
jgi:hypothetical protein